MQNGIKYYQFGNPIKIKLRKHYCLRCGNQLEMHNHSKVVNSKSIEAKNYDFTIGEGSIIGDVKFIHKLFYCPNCKLEIEPVTQLSVEDIDIIINKTVKYFKRKGEDLSIKKHFEPNEGIVINKIINLADIKSLYLCVFINNNEIFKYSIPLLQKTCWEQPYYFKLSKRKLIKEIKKEIIYNKY